MINSKWCALRGLNLVSASQLNFRVIVFFYTVLFLTEAYAVEVDRQVSTGFNYTSNAFLDENASVSELQRDLQLSSNINHQSSFVSAGANYNLIRRYYPHSYGDDTTLAGGADISLAILPRSLRWDANHIRQNVFRDYNNNDTVDNREIRQFLQTGPVFLFQLTPVDVLESSITRSWNSIETQAQFDSETDSASASITHHLSPLMTASISLSQSKTDFENANGYEISEQSISITRELRKGSMSVLFGSNEVKQSGFASKSPSVSVDVTLDTDIAALNIDYYRHMTHSSTDIPISFTDESGLSYFGIIGLSEVVEEESFGVRVNKQLTAMVNIGLMGYRDTSTAQLSMVTRGREGIIFNSRYNYFLSGGASMNLMYSLNYLESSSNDNDDTSILHSLGANYQRPVTQRISLDANANFSLRDGSSYNDFDRSSISLRLAYAFY